MTEAELEKLKREVIASQQKTTFQFDQGIRYVIDYLNERGLIVVDGEVIVPMEPSEKMIAAGTNNTDEFVNADPWYGTEPLSDKQAEQCYKAMVFAQLGKAV